MKKILFAVVLLVCLFGSTLTASAANGPIARINMQEYNAKTGAYTTKSNVPQVIINIHGYDVSSDVPAYVSDDRTLVPIIISENLGAKVDWDNDNLKATITKDGKTIELTIGDPTALVDGREVAMPDNVPANLAVYNNTTRTMVPIRFISEQLGMEVKWNNSTYTAIIQNYRTYNGYKDVVVVVDAGHGGKDSGASGNGLVEKTVNLEVALKLETLLKNAGFTVYMTRSDDTYPENYGRATLANEKQADIFLSVHHNSATSTTANGVLTIYDGTMVEKKEFGEIIQKHMLKNLDMKDANNINKSTYIVTRETNMASALAELGFLSNAGDAAKIQTAEYRQKSAQALFDAIKEYTDGYILNGSSVPATAAPVSDTNSDSNSSTDDRDILEDKAGNQYYLDDNGEIVYVEE